MTLGQAAKTARRGKATIQKALKDGTLSGQRDDAGRWIIDPAELLRVFPPPRTGTAPRTGSEPIRTEAPEPAPDPRDAQIALLTESLERERAVNDELRADLRAERERVTGLLAPPERRRWWPWGRS